jgi:hypothetical protein
LPFFGQGFWSDGRLEPLQGSIYEIGEVINGHWKVALAVWTPLNQPVVFVSVLVEAASVRVVV